MPDDICNLIGLNSVHISDVLYFYRENIIECIARKIEAGKNNSFGK